jgi:Putative MetA-pathway of phenol degradation
MTAPHVTVKVIVLTMLALCLAGPAAARVVKSKKPATKARELIVGSRLEFEASDFDAPVLVEWSPSKRLQLIAEPSYAKVQLDNGSTARGFKDLELSGVYEFLPQRRNRPSLALELDLKLPTSSNRQLGTGKSDVGIGLIAVRDFVHWDFEAAGVYTFVGSPTGQKLSNVYEISLSGERHLGRRLDVYGEIVGSGGGAFGGNARNGFGLGGLQAAVAEGGGTEGEFTLGVAEHLTQHLKLEQGLTYKSDGTALAILGWEYNFAAGD